MISGLTFKINTNSSFPAQQRKLLLYPCCELLTIAFLELQKRYIRTRSPLWIFLLSFPSPVPAASAMLTRLSLSSSSDWYYSPHRILILASSTKAAEKIYLALFFSLHIKYSTTIAWDVLLTHRYWMPSSKPSQLFHLFQSPQPVPRSQSITMPALPGHYCNT